MTALPPFSTNAGAASRFPTNQGDAGSPDPNELTLSINGQKFGGWTDASVTRSIERFPSTFELSLTEFNPSAPSEVIIKPGQACTLHLGRDPVLTGWIERYAVNFGPGRHDVTICGRSLSCDLLDCQIDLMGNTVRGVTMLSLAQQVCAPYGIAVTSLNGPGPVLPFINFFITQTPYDIIMQAARYAQFLAYDGPDGNLVLAQAGTETMASGFEEGVNIERLHLDYSVAERFSEYRCFIQSTDLLVGGTAPAGQDPNRIATASDPTIRHRVFSFVAEAGQNYRDLAQRQANWELSRRRGRSQAAHVTVDSWRDRSGKLWQPNALATINSRSAKLTATNWLIATVTFRRGEGGTHADLLLMPPEAFAPQPSNLNLFDPNVMKALAGSEGASATPVGKANPTGRGL